MEPDALIDELGGSADVAASLGVGPSTVGNWRKRGFPAWAIPHLMRMCGASGIDPGDALDPQPPRRAKAA